jgi:hypothetical protein
MRTGLLGRVGQLLADCRLAVREFPDTTPPVGNRNPKLRELLLNLN